MTVTDYKTLLTPLQDAEVSQLELLLKQKRALDLSTIDGLFTALVSSPIMPGPERWLPLVFAHHAWQDDSSADFKLTYQLLIRHLNGIESILSRAPDKFHPLFLERDLHDSIDVVVENWCGGYIQGIALSAEHWKPAHEAIQQWLYPIMVFSGPTGVAIRKKSSREQVLQWKQKLPEAARHIYSYWFAQRPEKSRYLASPFVREEPKIGRNDPCRCGSGKKFKHCCGAH
jgi:uncharacterized protein